MHFHAPSIMMAQHPSTAISILHPQIKVRCFDNFVQPCLWRNRRERWVNNGCFVNLLANEEKQSYHIETYQNLPL